MLRQYLIAIPAMEMVHTLFLSSILAMDKPEGTEVGICSCSLVYEARNQLAKKAINQRFRRVLWLDSDMCFEPDLLNKLAADMDEGRDYVCGIYMTRKEPIKPVIYNELHYVDGTPTAEAYMDYPRDSVFEIAGSGFGAVMMSVDMLKAVGDKYGSPFSPELGWGEDLSFNRRAASLGYKMHCDSRIDVGHVGLTIINQATYDERRRS